MDCGWSKFQANYDYEPGDDKEITLTKGDVLVVAKPFENPEGWLVGRNNRTGQYGEFPGTYVEYIGDVNELPEVTPDIPPPRPPKPRSNSKRASNGGHPLLEIIATRPTFCFHCEEYIWGSGKQFYKCTECELSCHLQCSVRLERFPCQKREVEEEEAGYVHLVSSVEEWAVEDVMCWLAAVHFYAFAEVFRENGIDGSHLQSLDEEGLAEMGIVDNSQQLSLLYALEELQNGDSPKKESGIFNGIQNAEQGSTGEHDFVLQSFSTLIWCDKCDKCLWGLYHQGVQCSVCGLCCHRMCKTNRIPICPRKRFKGSRDADVEVPEFGRKLGAQFRPSKKPAPICVIKCVEAIEERGLNTDSIYKITSKGSDKHALRLALNQDPGHVNMNDEEWRDPHCVATVLKMYFHELPQALFTEDKYSTFIYIFKNKGSDCMMDLMKEIDMLPKENKAVIEYLMKHLLKVSKHQDKNKMSSRSLAAVFSSILLRPKHKEIMKLALNHETQIRLLDVLITEGPWVKELPTPDTPPAVPPRPRSRYMGKGSSIDNTAQDNSELEKAEWYWGSASKETVNDRMRDNPDGTFIVRDSKRYPGEYTLTLMKGGVIKLIRIMYKDNKYGFSEPLTFRSVLELVNYYKERSLAQYNSKLDVRLCHPLSRFEQEEETPDKGDEYTRLITDLTDINREFVGSSNEYEKLYKNYTDSTEEIADLQMLLEAQRSVIAMLEDQLRVHEQFQREAPPQHRGLLRQNFELLKHRLNDAKIELGSSERELSNKAENNRDADKRMNSLRPQIIDLQRKKQQYMEVLVERGMTHNEVQELVNEGVYQVPDVDMSESNWMFGQISRQDAESLLTGCPDGTFMIRQSINRPGDYAVSLTYDNKVRHIAIITNREQCYGVNEKFVNHASLRDLVIHYHCNSLQKHNRHLATKLVYPLKWVKNDFQ